MIHSYSPMQVGDVAKVGFCGVDRRCFSMPLCRIVGRASFEEWVAQERKYFGEDNFLAYGDSYFYPVVAE